MLKNLQILRGYLFPNVHIYIGLRIRVLQSESIHSSLDIFKGSGHQKSESVFREFILRLELLSANYITTHLKLLSYSFECL